MILAQKRLEILSFVSSISAFLLLNVYLTNFLYNILVFDVVDKMKCDKTIFRMKTNSLAISLLMGVLNNIFTEVASSSGVSYGSVTLITPPPIQLGIQSSFDRVMVEDNSCSSQPEDGECPTLSVELKVP